MQHPRVMAGGGCVDLHAEPRSRTTSRWPPSSDGDLLHACVEQIICASMRSQVYVTPVQNASGVRASKEKRQKRSQRDRF